MLKNSKKILLILILFFTQSSFGINIIFDLGGVLIETNMSSFASQISLKSFIIYLANFNNPLLLKKRLFQTLENIPAKTTNTFGAGDDKGKKIPDIMCDWLSGDQTSTEIKTQAIKFLENKPEFCRSGERAILSKIINLMFTPQDLAKSCVISQEGLNFAKLCKQEGHKLFVLSNWDLESSFLLVKQYPELFDLFDQNNIIFSGQIGLIKPDPKIYEYILKQNNLDAQKCIFFDDQEINVNSAKQSGIYSVLCKNLKCTDMVKELNKFTKLIALQETYEEHIIL